MRRIKVLLVNMPPYLADVARLHEVSSLSQKIKLHYGNGLEHFAYLGKSEKFNEEMLPLFGWSGKTRIAE